MKKFLLGTAAVLALGSTSALAADLGTRPYTKAPAPAYVAPIYNWTGFYIGAHIGGAWNGNDSVSSDFAPGDLLVSKKNGAFLGGGQLGADFQFAPNWLIGVEGQISGLSDNDRHFADANGLGVIRDRSDWLASVTGRLGYTWGPGLLYVKGGVAFRDDNGIAVAGLGAGEFVGVKRDQTGYTVGGGLEYMFAPAWSAKIEYQYYNFGTTDINVFNAPVAFPSGTGLSYRDDLHTVKAGINYHFNWGGPVAARY